MRITCAWVLRINNQKKVDAFSEIGAKFPHMTDPIPSEPQTRDNVPAAPPVPAPHALGPAPVEWKWPDIHPESYRFAGIAGIAAIVAFMFDINWLAWLLVLLTVGIAAFFRDPKRASPAGADLILSPADGLVSQICEVELPKELVGEGLLTAGTVTRISIFMSVFDVHINRTPIAGTVRRVAYVPGRFLNASLDKASEENERQYMLVESPEGVKVGFTQIAGLVARRIVGFVREDVVVGIGQRIGLIRFGSRVDVFLPAGYQPQVVKGQRAVAGETVLATPGGMAAVGGPVQ